MRAAIYARYSSDLSRDASIEDQVRLCRAYAVRAGWEVTLEAELPHRRRRRCGCTPTSPRSTAARSSHSASRSPIR